MTQRTVLHTKNLHILPKLCIDEPYNKERFFSKYQSTVHNGDNRIHRLPFLIQTMTDHNGE